VTDTGMSEVVVAALYKFVTLEDFHELREPLLDACVKAGTLGSTLAIHLRYRLMAFLKPLTGTKVLSPAPSP